MDDACLSPKLRSIALKLHTSKFVQNANHREPRALPHLWLLVYRSSKISTKCARWGGEIISSSDDNILNCCAWLQKHRLHHKPHAPPMIRIPSPWLACAALATQSAGLCAPHSRSAVSCRHRSALLAFEKLKERSRHGKAWYACLWVHGSQCWLPKTRQGHIHYQLNTRIKECNRKPPLECCRDLRTTAGKVDTRIGPHGAPRTRKSPVWP